MIFQYRGFKLFVCHPIFYFISTGVAGAVPPTPDAVPPEPAQTPPPPKPPESGGIDGALDPELGATSPSLEVDKIVPIL